MTKTWEDYRRIVDEGVTQAMQGDFARGQRTNGKAPKVYRGTFARGMRQLPLSKRTIRLDPEGDW